MANFGEKTESDGTAESGSVEADIVVSMGESTLVLALVGDEAHLGLANVDGPSRTKVIKVHSDLIAVRTSDTT